ncbi:phospho-sugar mutase [Brevibacterium pityocampae]|uniref:Phospho-sugar mutase n=2 Tax=Brevibacteriaceae TaxID=85019 RepID=A0ABP8JLX2_9MICO
MPEMARVADRFSSGFDAQVVRDWIADDPDPVTRAELQDLLEAAVGTAGTTTAEAGDGPAPSEPVSSDSADPAAEVPGPGAPGPGAPDAATQARAELEDRFLAPLSFGTAGLRGAIAAGPNRMNRAVVIRAAAGVSHFLRDTLGEGFTVVIGCDARHGSADFARDTAAVVTAAGGRAILLPAQLPTPVLALAVNRLGADAGVMVTASHNPPADNGYKVYLGEAPLAAVLSGTEDPEVIRAGAGAQIVPPFDALIAEAIAAVPSVAGTPRAESGWEMAGEEIVEEYLAHIDALGERRQTPVRIVMTSLHGVGGQTALRALERCGFSDVHVVGSQADPDPEFPTVAFPNPEEHGALDAALDLAAQVDADLIIAHDPDADRFSAAIPVAAHAQHTGSSPGPAHGDPTAPVPLPADSSPAAPNAPGTAVRTYRQLTGDEVGLLLGERIASRVDVGGAAAVLANSIVSSQALSAVAAAHGLTHANTLTGFKWISRVPGLVFGYEEALGYCVAPQAVRDKDGISASIVFAGLVSELAGAGSTVEAELARIRQRDGVFLTAPVTFRMQDTALIAEAMERVRTFPPEVLAGSPVTRVVDMAEGLDALPPTDGVAIFTASGGRVIIRPSGTEPKLKCYLEVTGNGGTRDSAEGDAGPVAHARSGLDELVTAVQEYLGL